VPLCSDCTGSNRRYSEPSSSMSRSSVIDLPHTSRKIRTHPTIKWTKKQHDTPRALHIGYRKHMRQPLSEMSYTHRDFFGFVPPPSFGSPQASTNKEYYNNVERGHLTHQCSLVLNRHISPILAERSRMTIEEESTK
jgi:hypothetical protein